MTSRDAAKWFGGAVATALLQPLLRQWIGPFDRNPWLVAGILVPLAAAVWILGWPLYRDRRVLLGGGFIGFFLAYCLLFSLAAGTDLLAGPRTELRGYGDETPSNWLGLGRLGDWRYRLAPAAPGAEDLLVVLGDTTSGRPRAAVRRDFAFLIQEAVKQGAKGIAFDFFLEQPAEPALVDRLLCRQLEAARKAGVPVLFGYRHEVKSQRVNPVPLPESLRDCLPDEQLGSLAGYREADGEVRMVPLYLRGDETLESLSLRAARLLAGARELELPESRLVQFVPPAAEPSPLPQWPKAEQTSDFKNRFVFVGVQGNDVHDTPFGEVAGVRIHGWAAHALRGGTFLRRADPRWIFLSLFGAFYVLTLVQARGGGRRRLLAAAAILSLAFVIAAALAIRFGRLWIDVSYAWVGLWCLTGVLSGGAALQAGRKRPEIQAIEDAAGDTVPQPKDVFLSHNSRDKPAVRKLARKLEARGLTVWLDEWELVPGRPWQEALEEAIETVRSAAVMVGPSGLGPWEIPEMRACLSECVERNLPVIPILLPDAPESPDLPLFLRRFTWIDLRQGLSETALDRLEWGITGTKPKRRREPEA